MDRLTIVNSTTKNLRIMFEPIPNQYDIAAESKAYVIADFADLEIDLKSDCFISVWASNEQLTDENGARINPVF